MQSLLVVDDNANNLFVYEKLLTRADRKLIQASSGRQALDILSREVVSLILLDVQMPDMNGFEVAQHIKANPKTAHVPIIFISAAFRSEDFINRGFALGAVDYITKPVEPFTLRNKVEVFLQIQEQQAKISELNAALTGTVEKQAQQLTQQQIKLIHSDKMSMLGQITASIAHEINNPLTVIHSKAGIIKEKAANGTLTPEIAIKSAEKIESTVLRITRTIKALRAFSRSGDNDPFVKTPLKGILEETLEIYGERGRSHGIEFKLPDLSPDFAIECRAVQISQVLLNLIQNAHDAILGGESGNATTEKWIKIEAKDLGDSVELSVTNSGQKIPTEIQNKLFQTFFTTKAVGKGTGLGLSISKRLIEDHRGDLVFDPSNEHTCFRINLPKHQPQN